MTNREALAYCLRHQNPSDETCSIRMANLISPDLSLIIVNRIILSYLNRTNLSYGGLHARFTQFNS